ncbi:DUF3800 domain-containing protein [Phaeobacter inhibens]|uniref:DUF3800 domain-containing protein n=1 Tax=Phaeobacter inhibens TaxID=221822 RepID=UPI0021A6A213|nr:DUF3800 domain-containing protein [Phaeobacter inhibens]UWR91263.1 DUF3800 domain-containing protein [Phaeobacter inhibens]
MKICYIDEAGCTGGLPTTTSSIQPTLTISGIFLDYSKLHQLTTDLIELKQRFFPKLLPITATHLDWIKAEVKGSDLRKRVCSGSRSDTRHAFGVLDKTTTLIERAEAKLVGRVWVKGIGKEMKGIPVYTSSIQSIYSDFQRYLTETNDYGFVVADSRVQHLNTQVAHSIFTQKFKGTGDAYDRIIELPAFSHSDNHAGLQVSDLLASAFITPIAINTYCEGHLTSVHVRSKYHLIKDKYRTWLKGLQYRYKEASGRSRGGIIVSDSLSARPGGEMFR